MSDGAGGPAPLAVAALLPEEIAAQLGLAPAFRGRQIFRWIHRRAADIPDMSDLPADLRGRLAAKAAVITSTLDARADADDGAVKLRLQLADGAAVEAMALADGTRRLTACLSTQSGCGMGCVFCRTGLMGLVRNLAAHEIVEQLLHLRRAVGDIDTVVFMGMGEPLANRESVARAVAALTHPAGLGMSPRRITLSTCGIVDGIQWMAGEGPRVRLAVSLVSAVAATRERLMPIARTQRLGELKEALLDYQRKTRKRVTLEIVLIGGETDRDEDIGALLAWVPPLSVLVNLIPWNPVPEMRFPEPTPERVARYAAMLQRSGIPVTQRLRKGRGVCGACGQLAVLGG